MLHYYFGKDFAKQFRNECGLYSATPEYHYGNLLVKQFAGNCEEVNAIALALTETFFNTQLVYKIMLVISNKAIPATSELSRLAERYKMEFEYYLQHEPYTAHYYNDLIAMLDSFSRLINGFNTDFENQVYGQLSTYHTVLHTSQENYVAESVSLSQIIEQTEFYLKNVMAYYNYFIVAWQYEANNSKGVALTTYMADHLRELITGVEETLACMEDIRTLLLTWEVQMEIREDQELLN